MSDTTNPPKLLSLLRTVTKVRMCPLLLFPSYFCRKLTNLGTSCVFCVEIVIYNCQMLVFTAYRAILAEPRTKASAASEDYSGGSSRNDYMGGAEQMNQYALPLGK